MSKKMIAPQTNITIVRPRGITDQKTSSQMLPSIGGGRSASERRRYLTAKNIIRKKISALKNPATATRKKNSASTLGAMVDACSGNRGKPIFMASGAVRGLPLAAPVPAQHHDDKTAESDHSRDSAEPNQIGDEKTVLTGGRIVVITKEQKLIDGRGNLVRRGFDQPQTQIPRRKFDAVKIARDFAAGREEDNAGRVTEAVLVPLIVVTK